MEEQQTGWGKYTKLITGMVVVGVVSGLFWIVFYASFLANIPKIIQIRNIYFDQL